MCGGKKVRLLEKDLETHVGPHAVYAVYYNMATLGTTQDVACSPEPKRLSSWSFREGQRVSLSWTSLETSKDTLEMCIYTYIEVHIARGEQGGRRGGGGSSLYLFIFEF